ncbi:hypothetical protein NC653_032801 [Populus alba x Populus x berolinensis]|uniref:Uncharacterized protein n=1 Tax=Populus alba x Populus x berolinensis TaxID=444605 RepID=A0AAD6LSD0_9ROSI|nr:hypothetical protein NC653_032801 [Populus alba x Populus x berolinensis]
MEQVSSRVKSRSDPEIPGKFRPERSGRNQCVPFRVKATKSKTQANNCTATDFPTEEEANNCTINKKEKKPPPATWQRIIKEVDNSQVSTSPSRGLSHRRQNQKIHQTSLAIRSLPCRAKLWWFFLEPAEMTTKAQWLEINAVLFDSPH